MVKFWYFSRNRWYFSLSIPMKLSILSAVKWNVSKIRDSTEKISDTPRFMESKYTRLTMNGKKILAGMIMMGFFLISPGSIYASVSSLLSHLIFSISSLWRSSKYIWTTSLQCKKFLYHTIKVGSCLSVNAGVTLFLDPREEFYSGSPRLPRGTLSSWNTIRQLRYFFFFWISKYCCDGSPWHSRLHWIKLHIWLLADLNICF